MKPGGKITFTVEGDLKLSVIGDALDRLFGQLCQQEATITIQESTDWNFTFVEIRVWSSDLPSAREEKS